MPYVSVKNDSAWDYKNQPTIEFILLDKKEDVGAYGKRLYKVRELGTDKEYDIWGCAILDRQMQKLEVGARARLNYVGVVVNKGKSMKDFNLEVWRDGDDTGPGGDAAETDITDEDIPF